MITAMQNGQQANGKLHEMILRTALLILNDVVKLILLPPDKRELQCRQLDRGLQLLNILANSLSRVESFLKISSKPLAAAC